MATLTDVLTFSRAIAQTDSNGLTDTNGVIFANEALLDFHRHLIYKGVDASQVQEAYTNMVANQGTYLYPSDMFFLKTIEMNYQDQTPDNYLVAQQVDVSNLPGANNSNAMGSSFSWLRVNGSRQNPMFDDRGDWFEIFPTPVTGNSQGIRIIYFLEPTPFTSVSDSINYPSSLDYRTMGWRIAANYKRSLGDFAAADKLEAEYQRHLGEIGNTLAEGSQQPLQVIPIQDAGWTY